MNLSSIIYLSSATQLLSAQELRELLETSRRNNQRAGLGGILLYWDGNFLQYVEGPSDQIDLLMSKISADKRHSGIVLLQREAITELAFPEWTMAFEIMKSSDDGDGQSDFLSDGLLSVEPEKLSPVAHRLIAIFREQIR